MRDRRAQSTAATRPHQAVRSVRFLLVGIVLGALAPGSARAQQTATVSRGGEPVVGDIGGPRLGQLTQGSRFASGATRSGYTQVTLDGWMFRSSLAAAHKDGHTLAVKRTPVENLRDAPNGRALAQLVNGFLLDEVERRGAWVHVRRTVWVKTDALLGASRETRSANRPAASDTATRVAAVDARAADSTPDAHRAVVRRRMNLYRAPDSASVGTLEAGVPVRITGRAGSWVRVETQAWVRENEIRPSDNSILTGLTAAELRGAPDDFKGKLLRWTIQFLSLQTADELRPDFQPGQKYILARGPAPEYAFVYVIVPPEHLAEVQKLEPLSSVTVVARVVNGRSTYLANPILELVELP